MQALVRRLANAPRRPWPDRPVRLALAITDLDVGGAERALVALATRLDRRRWEPRVFCLGPEGRLAGPLRAAGIAVECLAVEPSKPGRAVLRLARALRRFRPALVQSFLFHANVAARLAAPLAGLPWVVGGLRVAERRDNGHLRLDRLTMPLAAGSVCVSEGVRRFSVEQGRLDPERLTVIPNAVDPGPFDAARPADRDGLGVPADAHLALYVGRLDPQKGIATLLEAAARVAETDPRWHLALAGEGPERPGLEARLAADPGLAARVHVLGRRDDVPDLLCAADLLVLPSLWEGMPNVVLEAMAARRAVVGTAVEGTEELVEPGVTGWLVPTCDPAALADALREAAADPGRLTRFGAAGRAKVEARHTHDRVVAAYERLWAGLLGLEPAAIPEAGRP